MKILLTNDDGYSAPGIGALADRLSRDHDVVIVAPYTEKSTTGHSLTLTGPVRVHHFDQNLYAIDGFPADCILYSLSAVYGDGAPDIVISGINRGGNLAQDTFYSGTVAGAREASYHNIPALAVSLTTEYGDDELQKRARHDRSCYRHVAELVANMLECGVQESIPQKSLLNLNVPLGPVRGLKYARMGFRRYRDHVQEREDPRGLPYAWVMGNWDGFYEFGGTSDCEYIDQGLASLTLLHEFGYDATGKHTQDFLTQLNCDFF